MRQRSVIVRNKSREQFQNHQDEKEEASALYNFPGSRDSTLKVKDVENEVAIQPTLVDCKTRRSSNSFGRTTNIESIKKSNDSIDIKESSRNSGWPQALHWGFARQMNPPVL